MRFNVFFQAFNVQAQLGYEPGSKICLSSTHFLVLAETSSKDLFFSQCRLFITAQIVCSPNGPTHLIGWWFYADILSRWYHMPRQQTCINIINLYIIGPICNFMAYHFLCSFWYASACWYAGVSMKILPRMRSRSCSHKRSYLNCKGCSHCCCRSFKENGEKMFLRIRSDFCFAWIKIIHPGFSGAFCKSWWQSFLTDNTQHCIPFWPFVLLSIFCLFDW